MYGTISILWYRSRGKETRNKTSWSSCVFQQYNMAQLKQESMSNCEFIKYIHNNILSRNKARNVRNNDFWKYNNEASPYYGWQTLFGRNRRESMKNTCKIEDINKWVLNKKKRVKIKKIECRRSLFCFMITL